MFKKSILLFACLAPMMVMANTSPKKSLVGDWICTSDNDYFSSTSLMYYRADGTASEMIEIREKATYYPTIEFIFANYDWHFKDGKLFMTNDDLPYYVAYYHSDVGMIEVDKELVAEMKMDIIKNSQENNWHYVTFDGNDRHHYSFEGGFMGDCHRLK